MMKIAYLLGSLNRGGTETLLLDVFRNAKQNELDAIGIYRKTGVYEREFLSSGLSMFKLEVGRNPLTYIIRFRKLLISSKVEIVHAQQPIDALYARLACIGTKIKIILTFHGYDYNDTELSFRILNAIIRRTHLNIYVSYTQQEYYQEKYNLSPNKQKVVYNGISFEKFSTIDIRSATFSRTPNKALIKTANVIQSHALTKTIKDELNVKNDTLLMGSVGNFVKARDQLTICRFLKLLKDQDIQFHFVFVGIKSESNPEQFNNCVEFCRKNNLLNEVVFLGSRDDVPQLLPQLDAFVYSTGHDTFGIAVVEAMAVGIPIFVNDWGVMKEITDDGKYATLYKTKDEEDLLQHFLLFLQNKEVFQRKAIEAAYFVRQKYSIEKHIETLKKVYNEVLSDPKPLKEM